MYAIRSYYEERERGHHDEERRAPLADEGGAGRVRVADDRLGMGHEPRLSDRAHRNAARGLL